MRRTWRLACSLLILTLLSGQNSGFAIDANTGGTPKSLLVCVFYATDRKPGIVPEPVNSDSKKIDYFYSAEPDTELHYGTVKSLIPIENRDDFFDLRGEQIKSEIVGLGWQPASAKAKKPDLDWIGYPDNPIEEITGLPAQGATQTREEFLSNVKSSVRSMERKRLSVYLHGYGSTFRNAAYTSSLLASYLKMPVICYSWPSASKMTLDAYESEDTKTVADPTRINMLRDFIDSLVFDLRKEFGPDIEINLITHSLGGRLGLGFAQSWHEKETSIVAARTATGESAPHGQVETPLLTNLAMIAPDASVSFFEQSVPALEHVAKNVLVFSTVKDTVLYKAQDSYKPWQSHAVGRFGGMTKSSKIRFIDYSEISEPWPIYHYLNFGAVANILRSEAPTAEYSLVRRDIITKPSDITGIGIKKRTGRGFELERFQVDPENLGAQEDLLMKLKKIVEEELEGKRDQLAKIERALKQVKKAKLSKPKHAQVQ